MVEATDPGWRDQLVSLAVGVAAILVIGLILGGWRVAMLACTAVGSVGVIVIWRAFDRRTLTLSGDVLQVSTRARVQTIRLQAIDSITADEAYHVGKQITIKAGGLVVPDLDPSSSSRLLGDLVNRLDALGKGEVCDPTARRSIGLI